MQVDSVSCVMLAQNCDLNLNQAQLSEEYADSYHLSKLSE